MATYRYPLIYLTPQQALDAIVEANETGVFSAPVYTQGGGAPHDDITVGGIPTAGKVIHDFLVQIDTAAAPDTFSWTDNKVLRENGLVTFTGAGLDDMTCSGTPDPSTPLYLMRVEIDSVGATDTFKYSLDGGGTWTATLIPITGAAQVLQEGIEVIFAAVTGHTLTDLWDWNIIYNWNATGVNCNTSAIPLLDGLTVLWASNTGHEVGDTWETSSSYVINAFVETNYVQATANGEYSAYGAGLPVLTLAHSVTGRGLLPTPKYHLVINGASGADWISFKDTENVGAIYGGDQAGTSWVNYVDITGITIPSGTYGIVTQNNAGIQYQWSITNCNIQVLTSAVIVSSLLGLCLNNNRLHSTDAGSKCINLDGSTIGASGGIIASLNNVIVSGGSGVYYLSSAGVSLSQFILIHNSFYTEDECIYLEDGSGAGLSGHLVSINNIFYSANQNCIKAVFTPAFLQILGGDGNVYYAPNADLIDEDGIGYNTLTDIQERWGGEAHSSNVDPIYILPTLELAATSTVLMKGRGATAAGINGKDRAVSVDPGAYQTSGADWNVSAAGGELTANISGRVPVAGI